MDINVNGVLLTAQAAGRQMARFGNGGSIVLIASMSGSITNKVRARPQATRLFTAKRAAGPRLGVIQLVEISGTADGPQHGLRTRP